jgi:hypothetical protein
MLIGAIVGAGGWQGQSSELAWPVDKSASVCAPLHRADDAHQQSPHGIELDPQLARVLALRADCQRLMRGHSASVTMWAGIPSPGLSSPRDRHEGPLRRLCVGLSLTVRGPPAPV